MPVALALIAIVPPMLKSGSTGTSGPSVNITGDNNEVNFDYSTNNTFVTNVNVIAREYELQTNRPLSDDLRQQVEAAVKAALANNHDESIRLFEQVAQAAPVPAVYNNLAVEYEKAQKPEQARRNFALSEETMQQLKAAAAKNQPLDRASLTAPKSSGPGVTSEAGGVSAMTIDPLLEPYVAPGEFHVVAHGTPVTGSYEVRYRPAPGTTVVVEPGVYDILMKASSYGPGFVFASNVGVKEGSLTHVNPNALVGGIAIDAITKKGFPLLKKVQFVEQGEKRLVAQETDRLGVTLPLAPGGYEVAAETADGQRVMMAANVAVKAGEITRFDPTAQVASILVHAPDIRGLDMKAVYALKAGTNQIVNRWKRGTSRCWCREARPTTSPSSRRPGSPG